MRLTTSLLPILAACATVALSQTTKAPPQAQSTACGDIISAADANPTSFVFLAEDVYNCLISVPFHRAIATNFIQWVNTTLQFQSTTTYLKKPPSGYQQPATDLFGRLDQLQKDVDANKFANQYAFEATLQTIIYSAHDAHLTLSAGVLNAFTFGAPYNLVTLSKDGVETPKVYIADDVVNITDSAIYSAITKINEEDVVSYLTRFAALNSYGTLEPNSDWNQLMYSSATEVQGYWNIFEGVTTFYPGPKITFTFENGTTLSDNWYALYNSPGPTGPLATGGDFYNFFVLGIYPASFNLTTYYATQSAASSSATPTATQSANATDSASATATATAWANPAYPDDPFVVQPDLGVFSLGSLTGYFLNDTDVAVLSIPTFAAYGNGLDTFTSTVSDFLSSAKSVGATKIIIDLQSNGGGNTLLAFDTFKQFFPTMDPYSGSRFRSHQLADVLGTTITQYWNTLELNDEDYYFLSTDEWLATDRLDATTGQNFTSWPAEFGPFTDDGDFFSQVQTYNLSSYIFDVLASGGISVYGYGDRPVNTTQPYSPDDIIILTNGICSSTCALFVELMKHQAGVRTVAVGGRPQTGPMQTVGGTRGASYYPIGFMYNDFDIAGFLNDTANAILPSLYEDILVSYAGVNLRDQIRKDDADKTPLQFKFDAADCRIYFTPQNWFNYTNLWSHAANAIWKNSSLCVTGSTGFATNGTKAPPAPPTYNFNPNNISAISGGNPNLPAGASAAPLTALSKNKQQAAPLACKSTADCPSSQTCGTVSVCSGGAVVKVSLCRDSCNSGSTTCKSGGSCQLTTSLKGSNGKTISYGFCAPAAPNFCSTNTGAYSSQQTEAVEPLTAKQNGGGEISDQPTTAGGWLGLGTLKDFINAGLAAWS